MNITRFSKIQDGENCSLLETKGKAAKIELKKKKKSKIFAEEPQKSSSSWKKKMFLFFPRGNPRKK